MFIKDDLTKTINEGLDAPLILDSPEDISKLKVDKASINRKVGLGESALEELEKCENWFKILSSCRFIYSSHNSILKYYMVLDTFEDSLTLDIIEIGTHNESNLGYRYYYSTNDYYEFNYDSSLGDATTSYSYRSNSKSGNKFRIFASPDLYSPLDDKYFTNDIMDILVNSSIDPNYKDEFKKHITRVIEECKK